LVALEGPSQLLASLAARLAAVLRSLLNTILLYKIFPCSFLKARAWPVGALVPRKGPFQHTQC
jgi:hypothetical protein